MSTIETDRGFDILARTIKPDEGSMSAEAARAILDVGLANHDKDRVNELAYKASKAVMGVNWRRRRMTNR